MAETIVAADVPTRWLDILKALRSGEHKFLISDGQQVQAVIIDPIRYRWLVTLAMREERRQRALALPLTAAESSAVWDAGFVALERISDKYAGLSDAELDTLFGAALSEVRAAGRE